MSGEHTQAETKRQAKIGFDQTAVAAVSNLQISALSVRNQIERTALTRHGLTWSGFVTLWVIWIWQSPEARQIAAETGLAKATLSGVLNTLEAGKLIKRKPSPDDKRIIIVTLTAKGQKLIEQVFPEFNGAAKAAVSPLAKDSQRDLASYLAAIAR